MTSSEESSEESEYLPKKAVRRVKQKNKRRRVSTKTPQAKVAKKVEILSRKKIKKKFFYEISYNGVVSPFLMPKEIDMTSWKAIKDGFNQKCSNADFAADHTIDIMEEECIGLKDAAAARKKLKPYYLENFYLFFNRWFKLNFIGNR